MNEPDAGLAQAIVAELYTGRSAITLTTRLGALNGPVPADITDWLTDLAAVDHEIDRR